MVAVLEKPIAKTEPMVLLNGTHNHPAPPTQDLLRYPLPTLLWGWGYKMVRDEATGQAVEAPLTLSACPLKRSKDFSLYYGYSFRNAAFPMACSPRAIAL